MCGATMLSSPFLKNYVKINKINNKNCILFQISNFSGSYSYHEFAPHVKPNGSMKSVSVASSRIMLSVRMGAPLMVRGPFTTRPLGSFKSHDNYSFRKNCWFVIIYYNFFVDFVDFNIILSDKIQAICRWLVSVSYTHLTLPTILRV